MEDNVTWAKAEAAYRTKGMSEKEIKAHKKAWKNRQTPKPKKGIIAPTKDVITERKSKLERLAAELEGKEF